MAKEQASIVNAKPPARMGSLTRPERTEVQSGLVRGLTTCVRNQCILDGWRCWRRCSLLPMDWRPRSRSTLRHDIVPILRKHCGQCHTGDKKKGGLSLNTRASLLGGRRKRPGGCRRQEQRRANWCARIKSDDETRPDAARRARGCRRSRSRCSRAGSTTACRGRKASAFAPAAMNRRSSRAGRSCRRSSWPRESGRPDPRRLPGRARPAAAGADRRRQFLRRASLDLIGLLPDARGARGVPRRSIARQTRSGWCASCSPTTSTTPSTG